MFGRTISKKTGEYTEKSDNFPHIKEWAKRYLPNGTILIGEIYIPGGKSNDVTKISGCLPTNAYKRQFESQEYGGPVHYYVFDIIRYKGESLIDEQTIDRVEHYLSYELIDIFDRNDMLCGPGWVELAQTYYNNFEKHLQDIFATGGEGMVFKKKDCPYRVGKRTTASQMFKYKESLDSVDLICIGLEDPTKEYTGKELDNWDFNIRKEDANRLQGKYKWLKENGYNPIPVTKPYYYNWKNAIKLGAYKDGKITEVGTVASGLTDADRKDMGRNPEHWLNKVVEVQCMSTTKDGALRHPVFRRLREDKNPEECLWEEIFKN